MTGPYPPLHPPILLRIRVVARAFDFDFVGVAAVPLVGLDPLARLEEITQNLVKNFNVGILTGRVRPLDPHQVPCEMSTTASSYRVPKGRLPRVLVGTKGTPLRRNSLLGNCHRAVVEHVVRAQPALEDNLPLPGRRRRRRRGGEDQMLKKRHLGKMA